MSKKHRDEYEIHSVETPKGFTEKVVYKGNFYLSDMPYGSLQQYKASFIGISIVTALLFLGIGFLNHDGSRVLYVILPYVILFLPVSFMIIASVSFYRTKDTLTTPQYDKTFARIKITGIANIILALASILGDVIFILTGRGNTPVEEIIFLTCSVAIAFCAFITVQIHKKIHYKVVMHNDSGFQQQEEPVKTT